MKLKHAASARRVVALAGAAATALMLVGAPASQANGYGHSIVGNTYVKGDPTLGLVPVLADNLVRGDTLTFRNKDPWAHTVTSDEPGLFDTGEIASGGERTIWTHYLPAGTYTYHCKRHPDMHGSFTLS